MSVSSPMPGVENNELRSDGRASDDERRLEITLEHARWRHFAWAALGVGLGLLLIFGVGHTVAWIGLALCAGGVLAAQAFARTLLHPAGVITLSDTEIALPPALCAGVSITLPLGDVRHAYFLRRALPWTTSGPVLVVETARGVFTFPRDWFAADSDQRRIATSLNRRLGRL